MARSYRPVARDQGFLLPPSMADWLPEDHLVWFVLDVIEQLDTSAFHSGRRLGGRGRQGFDPDMLLGVLVYGYATGERSSRRIERLCGEHVAFKVLCAQDVPDHTTLARFRALNQEAFEGFFAQVLRLCAQEGMVKVGVVSIDGTKIAANAAKASNRSGDWVREQAAKIAQEAVRQADAVDAAEAAAAAIDGEQDRLPPKFATGADRAANIKKAAAELARRDAEQGQEDADDQVRAQQILERVEREGLHGPVPSGVCPVEYHQARLRRLHRGLAQAEGVRGSSGVRSELRKAIKRAEAALAQAREDLAAGQVDMRGPAARRRARRQQRARARGGIADPVNLSDPDSRLMTEGAGGGVVQGYNVQLAVTDDHLVLGVHLSQDANDSGCLIPTLAQASSNAERLGKQIGLVLADAGYFTVENLTAAGPQRLIAPGKNRDVHTQARDDRAHGDPPPDADPGELMRHRMRDPVNAEQYKRRGATCEPVNAHLKDQIGLRRFARRGLDAVLAELNLAAACLNLNRLHRARIAAH